jgi:hypothetical protein
VTQGEDGQYHLLVSEMLGGCGLGAWQHNSIIRHATSSEIDGLYQVRACCSHWYLVHPTV